MYKIFFSIILLLGLLSCGTEKKSGDKAPEFEIKTATANGTAPYLTTDNHGVPVLCWTTLDEKSHRYFLSYAKWDYKKNTFGATKEVRQTLGMQKHKESMGKIAFKSDGTAIVAYGVSKPTKENRFAGYVAYTVSKDDGKTWSKPVRLVDEKKSQSQRFFDMARLPDGEVGMSWLDNRKLEPEKEGSSLYFAKTNDKDVFSDEKGLVGSTCQCCRTDIFVDSKNAIHIAFRDIIKDTIRDMKHVFSLDTGKTFSKAYLISEDNWVISGCPHTGPSIAENEKGLAYAWFTMGGGEGVYFCKAIDYTKNHKRILVSNKLYHPQMIGVKNAKYILAGEEIDNIGDIYFGRITASKLNTSKVLNKTYITGKTSDNSHAVLTKLTEDKILMAWTKHKKTHDEIDYSVIDLDKI